jgi:hypothetical protein
MKVQSSLIRTGFACGRLVLTSLILLANAAVARTQPSLGISNNLAGTSIFWSNSAFGLQWTPNPANSAGWQLYPILPSVVGINRVISAPTTNSAAFFRLVSMSQPTVSSLTTSNIAGDSVALSGNINPSHDLTTSANFEYGLTTNYGLSTAPVIIGGAPQIFSLTITNLAASTMYHFRVDATNSQGASNGADLTFTTAAITAGQATPTLLTNSPQFITTNSAFLSTSVNDNGANTNVHVYYEFGLSTNYGSTTPGGNFASRTQTLLVSESISHLMPATIYHYRPIAFNNGGTSVGLDISFKTSSP